MHLRNLSIARRAGLGFTLIALLVAALGAFALKQMATIRQSEVTVETNWVPSMRVVTDIRETMLRIRTISLRLALDPDPKNAATYKSQMDTRTQVLATQLKTLEGFVDTPEERTLYEPFKANVAEYQAALARSFTLADQGQRDALNTLLLVDMKRVVDGSGNQLQALSDFYNQRVEQEGKAAEHQYDASFSIVLVFVLAAAAATVLLALWLTRSIVQPLGEAVRAAETVAGGDLTQPLPSTGDDEVTRLFRALASMQQSLRSTLQLIHGSAEQLGSAATELDAVTQDSTRGVSRQNDEIEQAATAINEMTSAVEEVARNAVSTSEASSQSSHSAQQGRARVEETVNAIQALSGDVQSTSGLVQHLATQSQDIGKVLDVIRGIAEQTNLLALNAAIEAARAGESGRGFAVVADEVRALAHRTQQSTLEIDQMISAMRGGSTQALESMNSSNRLAAQTLEKALAAGAALGEITTSIGQISERNLVIASAAEQQAQVAREVDRNIVNIRDLSIQSASGVHQISVSSGELARLASELNQAVARFRV